MSEDNPNSANQKNGSEVGSINSCFPNEILEEILSRLSLQSDLCNAKFVCRRWRFIVDEMVGHYITLTSFNDLAPHFPKEGKCKSESVKDVASLTEYQNMAIRNLKIGVPGMLSSDSLASTIQYMSKEMSDFPFTLYPHVLNSLSCFEPLPQNIFIALHPMGNLKYLKLSLFSIASLSAGTSFQNVCVFRCLTTLIIAETSTYPEFDSSLAIKPLNYFLQHLIAPQITVLDITYPIRSLLEIEEDSTRSVIHAIDRLPLIKKLAISVYSPNQNFTPPSKRYEYPEDLLSDMEALGRRTPLESVELKDNHLHSLRPSVQTKAWIIFIKQQASLKALRFYLKSSIEYEEDVVKILKRNEETLTKLDLSCFPCEISDTGDVYFVPLNGQAFTKCSSLKTLKLSDKTVNTSFLPSLLSYVYVDAMLTNEDAHSILLSENLCLKQIDLKDTRGGAPKGFGYGVKIDTLCQFVEKRTVQRLIIYAGSTDDKFPQEGIPNGDMTYPKRLRKRKTSNADLSSPSQESLIQSQVRIDWQLSVRGFYENKLYDDNESENENLHHVKFKCATLLSSFH